MRHGKATLNVTRATQIARSMMRYAHDLVFDPEKEKRMDEHWCSPCWYNTVIAGAAMTTQPCAQCEKDVMYGSTNTSALCLECAKRNNLCAHCGAYMQEVNW